MSNKTNFNAPDALEEHGVIGLASELVQIKKEYDLNLIQSVKEKIQGLERYLSWLTKRFEENYGSINI